MPTIFTHTVIPLAIGLACGRKIVPTRLLIVAIFLSIAPDLDVIAFQLGIPYEHQFGHRGASHSLCLALLIGLLLTLATNWFKTKRWIVFVVASIATASHGLLDMFTNGGLGVAWWWPLDDHRYFFPKQFIEVSPLSKARMLSERGLSVLYSELQWVWIPIWSLSLLIYSWRKKTTKKSSKQAAQPK